MSQFCCILLLLHHLHQYRSSPLTVFLSLASILIDCKHTAHSTQDKTTTAPRMQLSYPSIPPPPFFLLLSSSRHLHTRRVSLIISYLPSTLYQTLSTPHPTPSPHPGHLTTLLSSSYILPPSLPSTLPQPVHFRPQSPSFTPSRPSTRPKAPIPPPLLHLLPPFFLYQTNATTEAKRSEVLDHQPEPREQAPSPIDPNQPQPTSLPIHHLRLPTHPLNPLQRFQRTLLTYRRSS